MKLGSNSDVISRGPMRVGFFCLFFWFLLAVIGLAQIPVGERAPDFRVISGYYRVLSSSSLKGKIIVIFYDTREPEVSEKNRQMKDKLKFLLEEQPEDVKNSIAVVPIINCTEATWSLKPVWWANLVINSIKEGVIIYGDWDGKFFQDYQIIDEETNFIIVDRKGTIRYSKSGQISPEETEQIIELLRRLVAEN